MNNSGWSILKPEPHSKLPTKQGGTIFLARDDTNKKKEYIGYCRVVNSPWVDVWIMEICVNPNYRRQGIGKALVDRVIRAANGRIVQAWGVDQGPKFFEALGFKLSKCPVYFKHTNSSSVDRHYSSPTRL